MRDFRLADLIVAIVLMATASVLAPPRSAAAPQLPARTAPARIS